jgi:hypothetical protein
MSGLLKLSGDSNMNKVDVLRQSHASQNTWDPGAHLQILILLKAYLAIS